MSSVKVNLLHYCLNENYSSHEVAGWGSYGVVIKAINVRSLHKVAIKVISDVADTELATRTVRELHILHVLKHINIISILEVELREGCVHMVTDYCEHDLHSIIYKNEKTAAWKALSQNMAHGFLRVFRQVIEAVKYLHDVGVIHRDIKPANILLDSQFTVKLCDFGFARTIDNHRCDYMLHEQSEPLTEYMVTRWYRAPELVLNPGRYGRAQDMWALGCSFAECISKKVLFPGKESIDQLQVIVDVLGAPSKQDLDFDMNPICRRFISKVQTKTKRNSLPKALKGCDKMNPGILPLVTKLLQFNPKRRITAADALELAVFHKVSRCPPTVPATVACESITDGDNFRQSIRSQLTSLRHINDGCRAINRDGLLEYVNSAVMAIASEIRQRELSRVAVEQLMCNDSDDDDSAVTAVHPGDTSLGYVSPVPFSTSSSFREKASISKGQDCILEGRRVCEGTQTLVGARRLSHDVGVEHQAAAKSPSRSPTLSLSSALSALSDASRISFRSPMQYLMAASSSTSSSPCANTRSLSAHTANAPALRRFSSSSRSPHVNPLRNPSPNGGFVGACTGKSLAGKQSNDGAGPRKKASLLGVVVKALRSLLQLSPRRSPNQEETGDKEYGFAERKDSCCDVDDVASHMSELSGLSSSSPAQVVIDSLMLEDSEGEDDDEHSDLNDTVRNVSAAPSVTDGTEPHVDRSGPDLGLAFDMEGSTSHDSSHVSSEASVMKSLPTIHSGSALTQSFVRVSTLECSIDVAVRSSVLSSPVDGFEHAACSRGSLQGSSDAPTHALLQPQIEDCPLRSAVGFGSIAAVEGVLEEGAARVESPPSPIRSVRVNVVNPYRSKDLFI